VTKKVSRKDAKALPIGNCRLPIVDWHTLSEPSASELDMEEQAIGNRQLAIGNKP
jgi:hypothetical protein